MLMDKSMPTMADLYDALLQGKGGKCRGLWRTVLFDGTHWLAHRVPRTKLVELNGDLWPYFTVLMVTALV